eukprot:g4354.t1
MLLVCVDEFAADTRIMEDMVMIGKAVAARKKRGKGEKTGTVMVDAEALWGMLYADDAGIVSEPKTMTMCLLPKGMEECTFTISASGQTYQQTDQFVYLGRTITSDRKADKEIVSRICRAWKCFRRHIDAMYDRRRVGLRLKVQLLQTEVVETLLYGCASWSLTADLFTKLNGAHHPLLTRCIGWGKWKRTDRSLSYAETAPLSEKDALRQKIRHALEVGAFGSSEPVARRPSRLSFASDGGASRVSSCGWTTTASPSAFCLVGALATGKGYRGGQENDWLSRLGEDLVAFGMEDEKERGKWKASALEQEEWCGKIEDGVAWFMRKWHAREAGASAKCQLARAEVAAAAAAAAETVSTLRDRRGKERRRQRRARPLRPYPYLLPNAVGSFFGLVTLVLVVLFLPETGEHASASEQRTASQQQTSGIITTETMETEGVRHIPLQQSPVGTPTRMTPLDGSAGGDGDADSHPGDDMSVHDSRHEKEGDEGDTPGIFGQNGLLAVPHVKTLLFLTGVVSMAQIGLDEVFPLYAQSTPDVGGLSWNTVQIGKVFVASGLVLALCLLILFPPLIKLLGMTAWQRLGWLVSIPCFIVIPAAKTLSWNYPSLFTAATVANTGVAVGLAAAKLALSVGSTTLVASDMRGKLGGLYNMFESVGRFLGPAGFATTYAWSVSPSSPDLVNFRFVFYAAAAILAAGAILAWGTMTTENLTRNDEDKGEEGDDDLLRPDVVLLDGPSIGSKTTTSAGIDSGENRDVDVDRRDNLFSNSFGIAGREADMV